MMSLAMMRVNDLLWDIARYMELAEPFLIDPEITVRPVVEGKNLYLQLYLYGDETLFFL